MRYLFLLALLTACGGEVVVPEPWEGRLCIKMDKCSLALDFDCPDELQYEMSHYEENCSDLILEFYVDFLQCWESGESCSPDCAQEYARFNYVDFAESWCPPIPPYEAQQ